MPAVQSYMAHHQGMILLAACNFLSGDVMVKRFHDDERIQSVELLLQEKIPQNPPLEFPHLDEPVVVPREAAPARKRTVAHPGRQSHPAGARSFPGRNQRTDHQCRERIQPMARSCVDTLAVRYHPGSLGYMDLRAGPGQRSTLVCNLPAHRAAALNRQQTSFRQWTRKFYSIHTRWSSPILSMASPFALE